MVWLLYRVETIRELFNGKIDATEAAEKYTSMANSNTKPQKDKFGGYSFWILLEHAEAKFPGQQDKVSHSVDFWEIPFYALRICCFVAPSWH